MCLKMCNFAAQRVVTIQKYIGYGKEEKKPQGNVV